MNKKPYIATFGFSVLVSILLALAITGAFFYLAPTGSDISNSQILKAGKMVGYSIGALMGLITLIIIGLLNTLRRILHIRNIYWLHLPTIIIGLIPSFLFGWIFAGEPRFTNIARMVIDFGARPVLLGTLVIGAILIIIFPLQLIFKKRS